MAGPGVAGRCRLGTGGVDGGDWQARCGEVRIGEEPHGFDWQAWCGPDGQKGGVRIGRQGKGGLNRHGRLRCGSPGKTRLARRARCGSLVGKARNDRGEAPQAWPGLSAQGTARCGFAGVLRLPKRSRMGVRMGPLIPYQRSP